MVRVTCRSCGVTTELELAKLEKASSNGDCVHCSGTLLPKEFSDGFRRFRQACVKLQEASETVKIDFPIVEHGELASNGK
jgi:hypothetical protein